MQSRCKSLRSGARTGFMHPTGSRVRIPPPPPTPETVCSSGFLPALTPWRRVLRCQEGQRSRADPLTEWVTAPSARGRERLSDRVRQEPFDLSVPAQEASAGEQTTHGDDRRPHQATTLSDVVTSMQPPIELWTPNQIGSSLPGTSARRSGPRKRSTRVRHV